jgi:predicted MFS family arabinose efflux permease
VISLFAIDELGFNPGVLGMVFAVGGVSSFFGALAAGRLLRGSRPFQLLGFTLLLIALGTAFVPLAHGETLLALTLLIANQLVTDPAWTVFEVSAVSLRQLRVPDSWLGRVNSTFRVLEFGALMLGALLGGLVGTSAGLRPTLWLAVGLTILAAAVLFLFERTSAQDRLSGPVVGVG